MIAEKLARFINNETRSSYLEYSPDHARRLLGHFGDPHRHLTTFHIAGTNGKGSVAHMLHAILCRGGYSTGLYTSPHLLSVNERIIVGSSTITDPDLEAYIDDIIHVVDSDLSLTPTYFDVLTVCAFMFFHESRVDAAVIEVGLGGRLDSTNAVEPLVSVITEISNDHTPLLGANPVSIAREKAGIIKDAVPVVTSFQESLVMSVLNDATREKGAPLFRLGNDFSALQHVEFEGGHCFDYHLAGGRETEIKGLEISLAPPLQVGNACCAVTAAILARSSFPALNDEAIREGLRECRIPGRFEMLSVNPPIIFDPAHNESALASMIDFVVKTHPGKDVFPVVTFMHDKNIPAMAALFRSRRLRALYYVINDDRCHHPAASDAVADVFSEIIVHDQSLLFRTLDSLTSPRSLFFFTGSFRLYRTALDYASHCVSPPA